MPNKKKKAAPDAESSLIVSRVQREVAEGKWKGKTGNTVIRSRVIHGDAAVAGETGGAKTTRKKSTRSRPTRSTTSPRSTGRPSRAKRTTAATPPSTDSTL